MKAMLKIPLKYLLYITLFLTGLGLFTITSSYVYYINSGTPFDWGSRLITRMPSYLLWILFLPAIYSLVSGFRIEKANKIKSTLVLLGAGIFIAALHRILATLSVEYLQSIFEGKEVSAYNTLFSQKFALLAYMFDSYIMYWIVTGILLSTEYYRKYTENRLRASELEQQLAKAEVSALKMQINPHFLFNTLNSISALTHKDPDEADRMICLLSDLLRVSLDNTGRHFVPLKAELDFLDLYLQIQKIRYKERLTVNITTDPGVKEFQVPHLILQPVVENSIKHVLEKNVESCIININSFAETDKIIISVRDNGKGIEPHKDPFTSGMGLSNLKNRLDQLYGNRYQLVCSSPDGKGFELTIKLPLK